MTQDEKVKEFLEKPGAKIKKRSKGYYWDIDTNFGFFNKSVSPYPETDS